MPGYDKVSTNQKNDSAKLNQSNQITSQKNINPAHIIGRLRVNPQSFSPADAMVLQKTIGNKAVCQLMSQIGLTKGVVQSHGTIQMQRNRRRWTPQQRAQSQKFWEHKRAKELRKKQALEAYVAGLQEDLPIEITTKQAETLYSIGLSRPEVINANEMGMTPGIISALYLKGFTRSAFVGVIGGLWPLDLIIQWRDPKKPSTELINMILVKENVDPWTEAAHNKEKAEGERLISGKPKQISETLHVNTSKALGGAFVLKEKEYESACVYESVKQALRSYSDLHPDIYKLVKFRKVKCITEKASQVSDKIYFKHSRKGVKDATAVHELIHFYGAQDAFIKEFCFGKADRINEGFTEYFAQQVEKPDEDRKRAVYREWVRAVDSLAKNEKIGIEIIKNAYFTGNAAPLKAAYAEAFGTPWSPEEEQYLFDISAPNKTPVPLKERPQQL